MAGRYRVGFRPSLRRDLRERHSDYPLPEIVQAIAQELSERAEEGSSLFPEPGLKLVMTVRVAEGRFRAVARYELDPGDLTVNVSHLSLVRF